MMRRGSARGSLSVTSADWGGVRVLIVGGGIGGLSLGLSLRAAGIADVEVLESAPAIDELGVGINVLPHAVRELTELGLADELAVQGLATSEFIMFNKHGQALAGTATPTTTIDAAIDVEAPAALPCISNAIFRVFRMASCPPCLATCVRSLLNSGTITSTRALSELRRLLLSQRPTSS